MKLKILLLLLLTASIFSYSQPIPGLNYQPMGNANTLTEWQGIVRGRVGIIIAAYPDTTSANLTILKNIPYSMIATPPSHVWIRNSTAKVWVEFGGGGSIGGAGNLSPLFTTGVSGSNITFALSNTNQYTLFGRTAAGNGLPSFINSIDSNLVSGLHTENYYNTKYGKVTSVSTGNLSPIFTAAFSNPTTTPALAFTLSSTTNYTLLGRASGTGVPSYLTSIDSNWVPTLHSELYYNTKYAPINIGVGEVNVGQNLGGGIANYSGKSGVTLQFNSFNSKYFKLSSNLLSIPILDSNSYIHIVKKSGYNETGFWKNDSIFFSKAVRIHGTGFTIDTTASDDSTIDYNITVSGGITGAGNLSPLFTTGVSGSNITFALSNAAAYSLYGRASGTGVPSFIVGIDSNWIPALHSENYYNTLYQKIIKFGADFVKVGDSLFLRGDWVNVDDFGADSSLADNTAKFRAAIATGKDVIVPSKTYKFAGAGDGSVMLTLVAKYQRMKGVGAATLYITTNDKIIRPDTSSIIEELNFKGTGLGDGASIYQAAIWVAVHPYAKIINCNFEDIAGLAQANGGGGINICCLAPNDQMGLVMYGNHFKRCKGGIVASNRGEYWDGSGNEFDSCLIAMFSESGNFTFNHNIIIGGSYGTGIKLTMGTNGAHGNITNNLINHTKTPFDFDGITFGTGMNIANNYTFYGVHRYKDCNNIRFSTSGYDQIDSVIYDNCHFFQEDNVWWGTNQSGVKVPVYYKNGSDSVTKIGAVRMNAATVITWLDQFYADSVKFEGSAFIFKHLPNSAAADRIVLQKSSNGQLEYGGLGANISIAENNLVVNLSAASLQADTIPLFTFGGGGANAGDTSAFTTTTIYGSFKNDGVDTFIITKMVIVMQGTSDTLDVNVYYNDTVNVIGTKLKTTDVHCNNNYTGTSVTSFDNPKIPPGNWVWCKSPAVVDGRKPTYLSVTLIGIKIRNQ